MTITPEKTQSAPMVPCVIVVIRDEEWMVTKTEQSEDGWLVHVRGLSELVKDTTAVFYDALDDIEVMDPTQTWSQNLIGRCPPAWERSTVPA